MDEVEFGAAPTRGLADGAALKPISAAVVIGIGGSGIQTITRLRSAVHADRPDQAAIDSLKFLGVDAVDLTSQQPPLPDGVSLDVGEFFNVTEDPFQASVYVRGQLSTDTYLQQWWDPDYQPPMGPITEGLKRERMLGRLAFHRVRQDLITKIGHAMSGAISISEHLGTGGEAKGLPTIPVYIACSSAGGTGSSGFLEVVFAVWQAAQSGGYYPEIRAFIYLPSVFRNAVTKLPGGLVAAKAQEANTYAFFREVDHFCRFSSHLGRYFGRPYENGGPDIPDGDLLKQVYVIDNTLRGKTEISSIGDMYEIAAEAMYHFTLTNVGMPLVGVDATNTDRALADLDEFDKPRRYCGLGIARVVFPGETLRYHLVSGYIDWYLRESLLAVPKELQTLVRDHDLVAKLEDRFNTLEGEAGFLDVDDDVQDFLDIVEVATSELERIPEAAEAEKHIRQVERRSPGAIRSVQEEARGRNRLMLDTTEDFIEETIFQSGYGVAFAAEALRVLSKQLNSILDRAEIDTTQQVAGRVDAEEQVRKLLKDLYAASRRNLHERIAARLVAVVGKDETKPEIAARLGRAIQVWVQAIYDAEIAEARFDLFQQLNRRVRTMRLELERATERLNELAEAARRHWSQDALLGKDAGPLATTTLLPADAQPQVEDCAMARQWLTDIKDEHADVLAGEPLVEFLGRWSNENSNRGFFSLGSDNEGESTTAERSLVAALRRDARNRALYTVDPDSDDRVPRLPGDLKAVTAHDPDTLRHAIGGLVNESRSVCWSWEEGRLRLSSPGEGLASDDITPTVTTVIAHPASVTDMLTGAVTAETKMVEMADDERVVALSCEWAVPIHALHQMHTWRASYRQQAENRSRGKRARTPPMHIDRRFEFELEELVPEYFEPERIGEMLGQALVFGSLLGSEDEQVLGGYDHSRTRPAVPLLSIKPDGNFEGHVIRVVDDRLVSDDGAILLGDSWTDCFTTLGSDARMQASIVTVSEWLIRTLGANELHRVVDSYVDENLETLIDAVEKQPKEKNVLLHVLEGLQNWEIRLQSLTATGM